MVALAADRNTPRAEDGLILDLPMAAASILYAGAIACRDAAGNAVKGTTSTTLKALGRAEARADNSAGIAGAINAQIRTGIFRFANSTAGDLIAALDIGNDCFIVDDQTVAKTNGTSTRSRAGKIMGATMASAFLLWCCLSCGGTSTESGFDGVRECSSGQFDRGH